jgi:hypothetical protein
MAKNISIRFGKQTQSQLLEMALNPNILGISDWALLEDLVDKVGFSLNGNGCALIQDDRGIGKKYQIEKSYSGNKVYAVRTKGFKGYESLADCKSATRYIPSSIRAFFASQPCAFLGTYSDIEIDHKDGTYPEIDKSDPNNYQPINRNMNSKKRESCKTCKNTGYRYDARKIGHTEGWIEGDSIRTEEIGCRGCYMFDPIAFRQAFSLNNKMFNGNHNE